MTGVARSLFPSLPSPGSYNHDVITLLLIRHGIAEDGKGPDAERALSAEGWEKARAAILSGEYFLVVLDEITYPLIYGWLPLQEVLDTLAARPKDVHVCLTGRRCPQEIIDIADTVTEMKLIKHAFQAGIPAQRGIED